MFIVLGSIIAVLVIAVVVLVLVFTVFKGDKEGDKDKAGGGSDPIATAQKFYQSIEDMDLNALIGTLDPDFIDDLKAQYGSDYRDLIEGYFLSLVPEDFEFNDLKFDQQVDGDEATVEVTSGTITYRDEDGELVTEDIEEGVVTELDLVKIDGKWYIPISNFAGFSDYVDYMEEGGEEVDQTEDQIGLNTYTNDYLGISFNYPDGWTVQEIGEAVELRPIGGESLASVTISVSDTFGIDLDQWVADQIDNYESMGWYYDYSYTTFGGYPAAQFEYNYTGEAMQFYQALDIRTDYGGLEYFLGYLAVESAYYDYIDGVRMIIDSFAIL